jgi:NAD(P)-dependent dehydrogenase (short-subunit alcohol dehydrogenase family)
VFARKGWNVVVAARDPTRLQYVANDCAAAAERQGASLGGRNYCRRRTFQDCEPSAAGGYFIAYQALHMCG